MKKTRDMRLTLYLVFSFALAWCLWLSCHLLNVPSQAMQFVSMVAMWVPAAAVLITWRATGKGAILAYSMKPKIKGNIRVYLCAWLLPALICILGSILYFIVFPDEFDTSYSYLRQLVEKGSGMPEGLTLQMLVILQVVSALTYGPFINMLFALGEEIGWRGFLFPILSKHFSIVQAHLLTGLIWGFWHIPINTMGYNYGLEYWGYPWLGVIVMCVFTFATGVLLSWFSEKSGSIWPAALAHGSINAAAGIPLLFQSTGNTVHQIFGPGTTGLIAAVPMLILALLLLKSQTKLGMQQTG